MKASLFLMTISVLLSVKATATEVACETNILNQKGASSLEISSIRCSSGYEILAPHNSGGGGIILGVPLANAKNSTVTAALVGLALEVTKIAQETNLGISIRNPLVTQILASQKFRSDFLKKLTTAARFLNRNGFANLDFDERDAWKTYAVSQRYYGKTLSIGRNNLNDDFESIVKIASLIESANYP